MSFRQLSVVVPNGRHADEVMRLLLRELPKASSRFVSKTVMDSAVQPILCSITVVLYPNQVGPILTKLDMLVVDGESGKSFGCGVEFGTVTVTPVFATRPAPPVLKDPALVTATLRERLLKIGTARMSVEEIHNAISSGNEVRTRRMRGGRRELTGGGSASPNDL